MGWSSLLRFRSTEPKSRRRLLGIAPRFYQRHFFLGMNPGTPVFTTALNLTCVLIPSLISRTASSGMRDTSKFSRMRPGFFDVVSVAVPALDRPDEQHLRRRLVDTPGDRENDGIFQHVRLAIMTQRRKGLEHDAVRFAVIQQVPFRQVRVRFDVNDGRLDPRGSNNLSRLVEEDIRQSDGLARPSVHQLLQRPPRIPQRHTLVIDHVAVGITRVLVVAGLESEGRVNEIEIDVVQLEFREAGLEGRLHCARDGGSCSKAS